MKEGCQRILKKIDSITLKNDFKMKTIIEYKEIPNENLVDNFDDSRLGELYDELVEQFEEDIRDGRYKNAKAFFKEFKRVKKNIISL